MRTKIFNVQKITRKDNKNVVMLSEESYNNLMENIYVIEDICGKDNEGIGKPEPLTGNISGF